MQINIKQVNSPLTVKRRQRSAVKLTKALGLIATTATISIGVVTISNANTVAAWGLNSGTGYGNLDTLLNGYKSNNAAPKPEAEQVPKIQASTEAPTEAPTDMNSNINYNGAAVERLVPGKDDFPVKECFRVESFKNSVCYSSTRAKDCDFEFGVYATGDECCSQFRGTSNSCTIKKKDKLCYHATSHYPFSVCEEAPEDLCGRGWGVYKTAAECCTNAFPNGCGDQRPKVEQCWIADSYEPEQTCKFSTNQKVCNRGFGTYTSEKQCCDNVHGFITSGCSKYSSLDEGASRAYNTSIGTNWDFDYVNNPINYNGDEVLSKGYKFLVKQQAGWLSDPKSCSWHTTDVDEHKKCDAAVDFAVLNQIKFRGSALISGENDQAPNYFDYGCVEDPLPARCAGYAPPYTIAEKYEVMKVHVKKEVEHYSDRMSAWNVVGDVLCDCEPTIYEDCQAYVYANPTKCAISTEYSDPNMGGVKVYLKKNMYFPDMPDFINVAFTTAREVANPGLQLGIKETAIESSNGNQKAKSDMLHQLIHALLHGKGLMVDYVASDTQVDVNAANSDYMSGVGNNIQRYVEHGVKFHFTNVAVPDAEKFLTDEKQTQQATVYGHLFTTCINAINCQVFQFASFADTWNSNFAIGTEPFPFTKHFLQKKAASSLFKIINGGITNTYSNIVGNTDDATTATGNNNVNGATATATVTVSPEVVSPEVVSPEVVSPVPSDYEQIVEDSYQNMTMEDTNANTDANTITFTNDESNLSNTADSLTGVETDDLLAQLQAELNSLQSEYDI